ncbi:MAG: type II toxin-antitoxin system VapB family antitoxin [Chloroflexi bacterium]|nr:type II toxin-antitoxin system VapB family antitoxin [Chloroflexota bacterium]
MLTVTVDDELVNKARQVGRHQNEVDAVIAALQEYIARRDSKLLPASSLQDWVDDLYGSKKPENVVETLIAERREEAYKA